MQVSLRAVVVPATLAFQILVARSSASSLQNLRGSARNSTTTVRRLESCLFDITGTPEKYGKIKTVVWSGPCDTTFKTDLEAHKWCKENHDLDAVILKTSTGVSLDYLSCANQVWQIEQRSATDESCSWLPQGSVALHSHHDATAADIEGYNPFPTQFEKETGCRELCLSVGACVGYSWRSGGKETHTHYQKCFLISRVGTASVMKDEWFTSSLCEQRTPAPTTPTPAPTVPTPMPTSPTPARTCTAAPQGQHGLGQVPVCGCNSSILSQGTSFCLNGQALTVESSWDSLIPLTELAGPGGTLGVDMCLGATVVVVSPVSAGWNWKDEITLGSCKQSCSYDIKATPAKHGKAKDFQWQGSCGTTFTTVVEPHAWCKANFGLDAAMLKTSTGETMNYLSCANQDWSIEAFFGV